MQPTPVPQQFGQRDIEHAIASGLFAGDVPGGPSPLGNAVQNEMRLRQPQVGVQPQHMALQALQNSLFGGVGVGGLPEGWNDTTRKAATVQVHPSAPAPDFSTGHEDRLAQLNAMPQFQSWQQQRPSISGAYGGDVLPADQAGASDYGDYGIGRSLGMGKTVIPQHPAAYADRNQIDNPGVLEKLLRGSWTPGQSPVRAAAARDDALNQQGRRSGGLPDGSLPPPSSPQITSPQPTAFGGSPESGGASPMVYNHPPLSALVPPRGDLQATQGGPAPLAFKNAQDRLASVAASNERMKNGTPLMPGVLSRDGEPDMTRDPQVGAMAQRQAERQRVEGIRNQASSEIDAMGLPAPSQTAQQGRFVPGASAAGMNAGGPLRAPWQPQGSTGQITSGDSMLSQMLAADKAKLSEAAQQRTSQFDAENMRHARGNMLDPQNPSEAWQLSKALASGRSASGVALGLDNKREKWNEAHPGVPWDDKTQSVAIANKTQGANKEEFTSDQLAKQEAARAKSKSAMADFRGKQFQDAERGKMERQGRMAGLSNPAAFGNAQNQALMNSMLGDGENGKNPMAQAAFWGGPGAVREVIQGQNDLALGRDGGSEDRRGQYFGTLLAGNPAAANNPLLRRQLWDEAGRMANESRQNGQPQITSPQPVGGGQFNVPPPQVPGAPPAQQGVDPMTVSAEIDSLMPQLEAIGLPPDFRASDIQKKLRDTMDTTAELDENSLEAMAKALQLKLKRDPKFFKSMNNTIDMHGIQAMLKAPAGQRSAAYKKAIQDVNARAEKTARETRGMATRGPKM